MVLSLLLCLVWPLLSLLLALLALLLRRLALLPLWRWLLLVLLRTLLPCGRLSAVCAKRLLLDVASGVLLWRCLALRWLLRLLDRLGLYCTYSLRP